MKRAEKSGIKAAGDFGLGVINPKLPNSYFNLLCFLISYKTGTSLTDVQNMTYFDFMSFLYITGEFSKESSPDNSPEGREMTRRLGMGG